MNNNFENEERSDPIHRALADEEWNVFDAHLRKNALQAFSAAKRRRRFAFITAQAAAILFLASALTWVLSNRSRPAPAAGLAIAATDEKASPILPNIVTEEQMLAMFPPGSCLLAEVNGEKQLVFLDPRQASEGFPIQPQPLSAHN